MADFDKDGLMNILNSLMSDNKTSGTNQNEDDSTDYSSNYLNSELLNTAEIMTKMTGLIDKMNRCKNNKEFVLLSALKPYMRAARRGHIDSCLKVLQIVNVFNDMKKES